MHISNQIFTMAKNFSARGGREYHKYLHQTADQEELPDSENEKNMYRSFEEESTPHVQRPVQWTNQRKTTASQRQPDKRVSFNFKLRFLCESFGKI